MAVDVLWYYIEVTAAAHNRAGSRTDGSNRLRVAARLNIRLAQTARPQMESSLFTPRQGIVNAK